MRRFDVLRALQAGPMVPRTPHPVLVANRLPTYCPLPPLLSQAMLTALQGFDEAMDGLGPYLSGFTTIPVISMVSGSPLLGLPVPAVMPSPLTTVGFPLPPSLGVRGAKRKRTPCHTEECAICLDELRGHPSQVRVNALTHTSSHTRSSLSPRLPPCLSVGRSEQSRAGGQQHDEVPHVPWSGGSP